VSLYVDTTPNPSERKYTWKSAHGTTSGFIEKINFPIYHAKYYISVKGDMEPQREDNGTIVTLPNTYTLYASTSPGQRAQEPGYGGFIELVGSKAIDKNVPNIVMMKLRFYGMLEPLGRPLIYYVYNKSFESPSDLGIWQTNLATPCAMKINGQLLKRLRSQTFGEEEQKSRYEIEFEADTDLYYLLNIYAENDFGVGKAYQVFLSEPPAGDMAILTGSNIVYLILFILTFITLTACLMYWGKIRPKIIEKKQMKALELRKLLEEQRATAGDKKSKRKKDKAKAPGQK